MRVVITYPDANVYLPTIFREEPVDIHMPFMSGIELLEGVRKRGMDVNHPATGNLQFLEGGQ